MPLTSNIDRLLLSELGRDSTMEFLERIRSSLRISKVWSDENSEMEAERILSNYSDQNFSYMDALSFAIMNTRKIKMAFRLDRHFIAAGFVSIP